LTTNNTKECLNTHKQENIRAGSCFSLLESKWDNKEQGSFAFLDNITICDRVVGSFGVVLPISEFVE
jgi:hypothetical protein